MQIAKKSKNNKTRNADGKVTQGFFLNSLNPVIPFIMLQEKDAPFLLLKSMHAMVHFSFEYMTWI